MMTRYAGSTWPSEPPPPRNFAVEYAQLLAQLRWEGSQLILRRSYG